MKSYFLSYARADENIAHRFADDLIAAGVSVWVDQYEVQPSQTWDRAVEAAVRGCRGMLVVLSPRSVASPNVADEISVAIEVGKNIIPILVETCVVPLRLTRMQFIDATRDYDDALRRCLAATRGGEAAAAPPPPSPSRVRLREEVLQQAEQRLTPFMGPIAGRLVKAVATRVDTKTDLFNELAKSIPSAVERRTFLAGISDPVIPGDAGSKPAHSSASQAEISPGDLQVISDALIRHLGPIASRLVEREHAMSGSKQELCRRLGERIVAEHDRAAFLRDVGLG